MKNEKKIGAGTELGYCPIVLQEKALYRDITAGLGVLMDVELYCSTTIVL